MCPWRLSNCINKRNSNNYRTKNSKQQKPRRNKNNNNQPRRRKTKVVQVKTIVREGAKRVLQHSANAALSPIAQKLLVSMSMPHHEHSRNAYIPDELARHSLKIPLTTRAAISVPATGTMLIFINPTAAGTVLNTVRGTTSSFSNTNAYYSYTGTAPIGLTYTSYTVPVPFTAPTLVAEGISTRCVSAGVRLKYTGALLTKAGTVSFFNDVTGGQNLLTVDETVNTLLGTKIPYWQARPSARYINFNEANSHEFIVHNTGNVAYIENARPNTNFGWFSPASGGGPEYITGCSLLSSNSFTVPFGLATGATAFTGNPPAVMVISNTTSTALEFLVEVVAHYEYAGGTATQLGSPSPMDSAGARLVQEICNQSVETHHEDPHLHPLTHRMHVMRNLKQAATNIGKGMLNIAVKEASKPANAQMLAEGMAGLFMA